MRSEDLRDHLRKRPFRRFRLVLTDGRTFEVRHPELAMVGRSTVAVGLARRGDPEPMHDRLVTSRWWTCCGSSRPSRRRRPPRRQAGRAGRPAHPDESIPADAASERSRHGRGRDGLRRGCAARATAGAVGDGRVRGRRGRDRPGPPDAAPRAAGRFAGGGLLGGEGHAARRGDRAGAAPARLARGGAGARLRHGRAEGDWASSPRSSSPHDFREPGRESDPHPTRHLVRNIVARWRGSGPAGKKALLLSAHYDSVARGPGAGDDASGVAAILESLRALKAGPAPERDVIILINDGEEVGLFGADVFADEHPWAKDVGVVLNFDARGQLAARRTCSRPATATAG